MSTAAAMHRIGAELGKHVIRMTSAAGSGHPSSALSLTHLVGHLMFRGMAYDPNDPWNPNADRLVLSEGHAVPIVYAAYAALGGAVGRTKDDAAALKSADLSELRSRDSLLDGHPNPAEGFPFFDAATGSLGQGLSIGAGLALAARLDETSRRVFVIIGDGESREGQIWEAADFIADQKLNTVCAVFNCNGQGQAGNVSGQQSAERLCAKLEAFGWKVTQIDGHDPTAIEHAFAEVGRSVRPTAIVARTIKGWGVEALQQGNWHGKPLKESQLSAAEASLDAAASMAGEPKSEVDLRPEPPKASVSVTRVCPREVKWPSFAEAMESGGFGEGVKNRALATRRAYGAALKTAGELLPQVVCLDGDVSNSTFTNIFAEAHPKRFFECKIAEQNMVSAAVGLAAAGYIPFVNSFAKFISRAYDQIELASVSRSNIKIVGSHSGVTPAADGPSQMALQDVAYFRSLTSVRGDDRTSPLCRIYQPADAIAAYHCTRLMIELPGLCYMRTLRPDVPFLYGDETVFAPGGFNVVSPGEDLALVGSGYMVHTAMQAAEKLAAKGIRAAVIDAYTLPIDGDKLADTLRGCGRKAFVVEDNYGGGVGAEVAEIAARCGGLRVDSLHVQRIPKSTRNEAEALDYAGIGPAQIADHVLAFLSRPSN